jgi:hypothetical protein
VTFILPHKDSVVQPLHVRLFFRNNAEQPGAELRVLRVRYVFDVMGELRYVLDLQPAESP